MWRRLALVLLLTACTRPNDADGKSVPAPAVSAPPPPATSVTAATPERPAYCSRSYAPDAELRATPEGPPMTIEGFFAQPPASGRFTLEGFVQAPFHCRPCPEGAACKPCEEMIFVSNARGAYKGSITEGVDFQLYVHDATRFESGARYRLTFDVCARTSPVGPPERELRGYRRVSP